MWYEKEVTTGQVGTPDFFLWIFENLTHLWPCAGIPGYSGIQGVKPRALGIPDRSVDLCHL